MSLYYKTELGKLFHGDCLEIMKNGKDKIVDMILCDLPYEVTARNEWDVIIPFDKLWMAYEGIIKDNTAVVLTATQPFASKLVCSNLELFKYEWIWEKSRPVNFLNAKKQNLRKHEQVLVFYKNQCVYNPQDLIYKPRINKRSTTGTNCNESGKSNFSGYTNYPNSILKIGSATKTIHPTQKPVALFEYLIKTYTNEGDLVLDNCSGSGTTAIACENLNRRWICIEKEEEYCRISKERIEKHLLDKTSKILDETTKISNNNT